jgi:outer membrane protein assembly factor BamE (lipoprotein component of BamABCDE complex)
MKKIICYIFLTLCLSSCLASTERHGFMFDLSDYQLLQEGVTSRETTLKLMGSPTMISDLNSPESWIYYSEDVKSLLFFFPKVTARNILVIKFDESNTIKEMQKFDLSDDDHKLKFSSHYTEVSSHKTGFFKSIFSNIGQVKPQ